MKMMIDISPDFIVCEGEKLIRPQHISPSAWLEFWERLLRPRRYNDDD